MRNSARSRPTPSTGSAAASSARSATARLTYSRVASAAGAVCTAGAAVAAGAAADGAGARSPATTCPRAALTVTISPSRNTDVAVRVPTTHGMPSSRLTIAAWQVVPPLSVTTPAARRMVGTQSGEVIAATSTSPRTS